jgi:hypothetical protein
MTPGRPQQAALSRDVMNIRKFACHLLLLLLLHFVHPHVYRVYAVEEQISFLSCPARFPALALAMPD